MSSHDAFRPGQVHAGCNENARYERCAYFKESMRENDTVELGLGIDQTFIATIRTSVPDVTTLVQINSLSIGSFA